jgi:hypothetical protein
MHQLFVEERPQSGGGISGDLAKHLYGRLLRGRVVVVCDNPRALMSAVCKQWLKVCRQVQRERASTLDASKVLELVHMLGRIQGLKFSAKPPSEELEADVSFATIEQLLAWAPTCHTMYVTCEVTTERLHLITAWMPRGGVVVRYA